MTFDQHIGELDKLFSRVERNPFQSTGVNHVTGEITGELTGEASEHILETMVTVQEMVASAAASGGSGMLNGGFRAGPGDDTSAIDEDNPLPDWTITHAAGTGCTVVWEANGSSPSGYGLSFGMVDGSAGDETYFEQTVPLADVYRWFVATIAHYTSNVNLKTKVAVQFIDEDNNAIGAEMSGTWSSVAVDIDRLFRTPQSILVTDARVRFGVVATAGFSGTQTVSILFISGLHPQVYSVNISGTFSVASPAASTVYTMYYPTDVVTSVAAMYRTDLSGFVLGISARTSDTVAAGTGTVRVKNDTQTTNPGPTVNLVSGTTEASSTDDIDGASAYDFATGDRLHLELSTDASYSSTGSADYVGSARLLLVIHDSDDW